MKKTELAYIAGIIDGEGSISIVNPSGERGCKLSVSVGSTDEWLCQFLKMAFGGSVSLKNEAKEHRSASWAWFITTKNAMHMLEIILPYLHLKRPQAELAIKFQRVKTARNASYPKRISPEAIALEQAQHILMKSMNRAKGGAGLSRKTEVRVLI